MAEHRCADGMAMPASGGRAAAERNRGTGVAAGGRSAGAMHSPRPDRPEDGGGAAECVVVPQQEERRGSRHPPDRSRPFTPAHHAAGSASRRRGSPRGGSERSRPSRFRHASADIAPQRAIRRSTREPESRSAVGRRDLWCDPIRPLLELRITEGARKENCDIKRGQECPNRSKVLRQSNTFARFGPRAGNARSQGRQADGPDRLELRLDGK